MCEVGAAFAKFLFQVRTGFAASLVQIRKARIETTAISTVLMKEKIIPA
jgi:hypothetical protein